MKKSFVLYTDYLEHIEELSDEQAGRLLLAIMYYQSGKELPEMDAVTKMAFSFIRCQLDKDSQKYAEISERRREAGKMGGRPAANGFLEKQTKAKKANGFLEKQTKAKKPDNDNDNDNDNVNDNDINKKISTKADTKKVFEDESLNRAFGDYVEMRKAMKKPMTEKAKDLAVRKLKKLAAIPFTDELDVSTAVKVLEQSIERSWIGLFPLKEEQEVKVNESESSVRVW